MEQHTLKVRMYAGAGLMTIEEVSRITHAPQSTIERLIEEEIVRPSDVGDHSFVESGVSIGNDVTIKNGVSIWEGVTIEDLVFIGPNAAFTNDLRPRSKVYHAEVDRTHVREGASVGANATIIAGITIGR